MYGFQMEAIAHTITKAIYYPYIWAIVYVIPFLYLEHIWPISPGLVRDPSLPVKKIKTSLIRQETLK